jgi:NAD(P)-dependent dehydrogenase (short-subunit alcohol dehydrogenase family)
MSQSDIAIITGATGGMGRACARELGRGQTLVLTDIERKRLEDFAAGLREEGYRVGGVVAGDLSDAPVAGEVVEQARSLGRLRAVIHTAGLSPALATWDRILRANVVATELLLTALEAGLDEDFAAVLLASMAGHMAPADPALDALLAAPLADGFLQSAEALLEQRRRAEDPFGLASPAYGASKRAVIRMCEARATAWGACRARIVSISPGTIWTPMGRAEEKANPAAAAVVAATPMGRWGSPLDIAAAAAFLASDAAGFITGCDLRIDGGVTPALRGVAF